MRPFVAGGREKENDVPNESQGEEIRSHEAIDYFLAAGSASESIGGNGEVSGKPDLPGVGSLSLYGGSITLCHFFCATIWG